MIVEHCTSSWWTIVVAAGFSNFGSAGGGNKNADSGRSKLV